MKQNKIIYLLFVLLAFSATGCDDDDLTLNRIEPMVVQGLPTENLILSDLWEDGNKNPLLFTVKWDEPQFITNGSATSAAPVSYIVEIDNWGVGFKSPQTIAATTGYESEIFVNELNTILVKGLRATPEVEGKFELRVTATYGEGVGKTFSSSNVQTLTITPYPVDLGPMQGMYIIGDMNGWDTWNTDFRIFRANSNEDNRVYTYTGYLNGNFKFILEEDLGLDRMYYIVDDGVLAIGSSDEGSFSVNGKYVTITLDLDNLTYEMKDFDISRAINYTAICFVGDFCAWGAEGADPEMVRSEYDPHIWELKEVFVGTAGYGVKFRDNHSWDNRWCPTKQDDIPYGVGRLNPADDPNIGITQEGGNYYVKFNDLTGHYIVEFDN